MGKEGEKKQTSKGKKERKNNMKITKEKNKKYN